MKCPLTLKAQFYAGPGVLTAGSDCLLEECAVWDKELACCPIITLSLRLGTLIEVLKAIGESMPKEYQFRERR